APPCAAWPPGPAELAPATSYPGWFVDVRYTLKLERTGYFPALLLIFPRDPGRDRRSYAGHGPAGGFSAGPRRPRPSRRQRTSGPGWGSSGTVLRGAGMVPRRPAW